MNVTGIEWTTFSANPLKYRDKATGEIVWACVKHSPGCLHCYSETLALRYGNGGPFTRAAMEKVEPFVDEKELRKILTAKTVGGVQVSGSRCFIGDMTDIFGEWVPDEMLHKLFTTFESRADVTFQVLTKRADRMHAYLLWRWGEGRIPSRHIHLGVSVENQDATWRIAELVKTPAAVRFLSCEPLLSDLHLGPWLYSAHDKASMDNQYLSPLPGTEAARFWGAKVNWVIVGGESGPKARPCDVAWVRSIVQQCSEAGCPAFVKQLGSNATANYYDEFREEWESGRGNEWPDALEWNHRDGQPPLTALVALPMVKKGGDFDEFPAALRIREFPEVHA